MCRADVVLKPHVHPEYDISLVIHVATAFLEAAENLNTPDTAALYGKQGIATKLIRRTRESAGEHGGM